eukprot:8225515-Pyramimonas_sp.AAC.1
MRVRRWSRQVTSRLAWRPQVAENDSYEFLSWAQCTIGNHVWIPIHVAPHNHVQTRAMTLQNSEACHVLRFARRDRMRSLPRELSSVTTEPKSVFPEPPAEDDIIFETRQALRRLTDIY